MKPPATVAVRAKKMAGPKTSILNCEPRTIPSARRRDRLHRHGDVAEKQRDKDQDQDQDDQDQADQDQDQDDDDGDFGSDDTDG
jgi:hypothetical protein